jgi:aminoglycoside N3'-acetyltransferase
MNPNATCSVSLESYNPYLQPQIVSKNPKIYCIHNSLPKVQKAILATIVLKGLNDCSLSTIQKKFTLIGFKWQPLQQETELWEPQSLYKTIHTINQGLR